MTNIFAGPEAGAKLDHLDVNPKLPDSGITLLRTAAEHVIAKGGAAMELLHEVQPFRNDMYYMTTDV